MKKYKIYYDTCKEECVIGFKGIDEIPTMRYQCKASLEEIDDEIYRRERVNLEYRYRFKRLGIDRLDEILELLQKVESDLNRRKINGN